MSSSRLLGLVALAAAVGTTACASGTLVSLDGDVASATGGGGDGGARAVTPGAAGDGEDDGPLCVAGNACDPGNACATGVVECDEDGEPTCDVDALLPAGKPCPFGSCDESGHCSTFGGAFETNDPWALPCRDANAFTGACSCAPGTSPTVVRVIADAQGPQHGANVSFCGPPTHETASEYGGVFEVDDAVAGGVGCKVENPYTGGCSCPAGKSPVFVRTLVDTPIGTIIGGNIAVCMQISAYPKVFGGVYQVDDPVPGGLGCRVPNPSTGACSCPSGTAAQALRVDADVPGGYLGSNVFVCGLSASVAVFPSTVTLCNGVNVDATGTLGAAAGIQACVDATPSGGTLELPAGTYLIDAQLAIDAPITLRTAGTSGSMESCLAAPELRCAALQAAPDLTVTGGMLAIGVTSQVVLDHLILDGNRATRAGSAAHASCAQLNRWGFNASAADCTDCAFTRSASVRALCGTGFEWRGAGATITDSVFRDNGTDQPSGDGIVRWADGLTLLESDGAVVEGNWFIDDTDVALIFGGGINASLAGNVVRAPTRSAFAGIMLDNFAGTTSGNFAGTTVIGNDVDCIASRCSFGFELGPHPWYASANVVGGTVTANKAHNARVAINADGAGTAAAPMVVFGNDLQGVVPAPFGCGQQVSQLFNISPASVVDRNGEAFPTSASAFKICL